MIVFVVKKIQLFAQGMNLAHGSMSFTISDNLTELFLCVQELLLCVNHAGSWILHVKSLPTMTSHLQLSKHLYLLCSLPFCLKA